MERIPIGIRSVGILGVCLYYHPPQYHHPHLHPLLHKKLCSSIESEVEVLQPVGGGSGLEMANKLYKAQGNPTHGENKTVRS